jgi:hypothetical protein
MPRTRSRRTILTVITSDQRSLDPSIPSAADLVAGVTSLLVETADSAARTARPLLGSLARTALAPPIVPEQLQPARFLGAVAERGAARRRAALEAASRAFDVLVPRLLGEVLRRVALTQLILEHVEVDAVVAAVDLDQAAARLDVDRVVSRADLDAVLARIDVDDVVRRVDVDAIARRLDLDAVLDRPDLTAMIIRHVDLDLLVRTVLDRIDLVALAEEVIDGVALPEIIRESTGAMASDTVRGARMQGIAADEAVSRAVDRLLLRRGRRGTGAETSASAPAYPAGGATVPGQRDVGP